MNEGLKNRISNFRNHLRIRIDNPDRQETTISEEHSRKPVGKMEKRLSGSKRPRITDRVDETKNQSI
jgi:hypothetical protein